MPQAPSKYAIEFEPGAEEFKLPSLDNCLANPDGANCKVVFRQQDVLDAMYAAKLIPDPLTAGATLIKKYESPLITSGYDPVFNFAVDELTSAYGDAGLNSGLTIETTINLKMTKMVEDYLLSPAVFDQFYKTGADSIKIAAVGGNGELLFTVGFHVASQKDLQNVPQEAIINYKTADGKEIKLIRDTDFANFNRSPGSTVKPGVYTAAMEAGVIKDGETRIPNQYGLNPYLNTVDGVIAWNPTNYGNLKPNDPASKVKSDLPLSLNLPAIWTEENTGLAKVIDTTIKMGLYPKGVDLPKADETLTLGQFNARIIDLANYANTITTGGIRCMPTVIDSIRDKTGKLVYSLPSQAACQRVVDAQAAKEIRTILTDPNNKPGWNLGGDRGWWAKTGTTQNDTDNWVITGCPTLKQGVFDSPISMAMWIGNEDGTTPISNGGTAVRNIGPIITGLQKALVGFLGAPPNSPNFSMNTPAVIMN